MGKLNQAEVRYWLDEIQSCEERQKRELVQRWKYPTLVGYYEGDLLVEPDHNSLGVANQNVKAIINKHFPKTNVLISELMFSNPDIIADPTKPKTVKNNIEIDVEAMAPLMRGALVYAYDKTDAQEENRVALFDMLYAGFCAVEVDHIRKKPDKDENVPSEDEIEERRTGMIGKVKDMVDKLTGKAKNAEEAETNLAKSLPPDEASYADVSETYDRRWDPMNILFDWQAKTFKESRYLIKKRIIAKAKFDAEYPDFKNKVTAGSFLEFGMHSKNKEKQSVIVYEIQIKSKDRKPNTIVLTPTLKDSELDMYKRPYTTNGFNIKIGTLHKYGKIYPVPIARINKTLTDEMNEYIYSWKEVAERNIPKFIRNTDKVKSEDAIDAMRSRHVNDIIDVKGNPEGAIGQLKPTSFSNDNKELFAVFQNEQDKTWSVSDTRAGGQQKAKFATELQIQEAGFESSTTDIQEGLRKVIAEQLETMKDIIVTFWDNEFFFKVTGGPKPEWYTPETIGGVVINPLSEMLSADYNIKVDISKAFKMDTNAQKNNLILLLRELISEPMQNVMAQPSEEFPNGRKLAPAFINKIVQKFGQDAEVMFEAIQAPPEPQPGAEGLVPGGVEQEVSPEQIIGGV